MSIKIALAGNPNSGKTTLFNALTGSNQFVGNWPGVTVEKKEGKLKGHNDVVITDLPGIYSLSPYSLEEVVARNYLIQERPDAILNIVDGTNLERNLYLTTQLLELSIPTVIAVNMADILAKTGEKINTEELSRRLGCDVVEISAMKGTGVKEVAAKAVAAARSGAAPRSEHHFAADVEEALASIEERLTGVVPPERSRFFAVKLFERDEKIAESVQGIPDVGDIIERVETAHDDDAESIITNERYNYISSIIQGCYLKKAARTMTTSDKIDRWVTNRFLALPIFAAIITLVYYISVTTVGDVVTSWTNDVLFGEIIPPMVENFLVSVGCAEWLQSLILDGIVAGVGAVLGFVPQMLVLFFFLAFLESCGYMARIAFILDRIFRRFGLSGKSFIPMLIGTGCGVPGIMASRTIENDRDRKMTIMTTTFIPCSAKIPIIGLIAGALFHNAGWVATSAYFIGVAAIVISGILLKKTRMFAGDPAPFVMELPAYHAPSARNVLHSMGERGWSFIRRAGTVILLSAIVIWFTQTYGWEAKPVEAPEGAEVVAAQEAPLVFGEVENTDHSILGRVGSVVAPVFEPLGFGDWKPTVATVLGLVAKEEVVNVFGITYQTDTDDQDTATLLEEGSGDDIEAGLSPIAAGFNETSNGHGALAAFAFMIFNLLCAPCFAAIGAIKREMNNARWTWFAIGYQCVFAYAVALIVYQLGLLFAGAGFGLGTAVALLVLGALVYLLVRKNPYDENHLTQRIKVGA